MMTSWHGPLWKHGPSKRRRVMELVAKKCDGKVFEAEKQTTAAGDWYHKNCFRCVECNKSLDSLTNNDGSDGGLYCKKCYMVKYGPQTRSSDVDHKLIDLSNIKSDDAQKNCPRCSGAVFDNE